MNKLLNTLAQFNRREQTMLLACALAIFLWLLWMLVLAPLQHKRDSLTVTNVATEQSLGRVRLLATQIEQMSHQTNQAASGENIIGVIDASLRANSLQMGSLVPGANGEVRVTINKTNADNIMQWLYDLEVKDHIAVRDLNITTATEPGQVAVSARLAKQ